MHGFSPCRISILEMYCWCVVICWTSYSVCAVLPPAPSFAEPVPNITIVAGREAVLPCVVDNLGVHRVAWIKVDSQTVLTFHTQVIIHNSRITIAHNGHRNWDLHIKHTEFSDRGRYACQINSSPMLLQVGYLEVNVPPDIVYEDTSSDVAILEGERVTLVCSAKGHPKPHISWRREDGEPIVLKGSQVEKTSVQTVEGEVLALAKITRRQLGAYLCIASNGIQPSVSKRIFLQVNFEPTLKVPNQLVGAPLGTDVTLGCYVEASPRSINYWAKETGEILFSNEKYEVHQPDARYKVHMKLKIRFLEKKDFGGYHCVAKNLMGEAQGYIRLYEHDGRNDSFTAYKTLDSRKNTLIDSSGTAYQEQDHNSPRESHAYEMGSGDYLYPQNKNPTSGETGRREITNRASSSCWSQFPVMLTICARFLLVFLT